MITWRIGNHSRAVITSAQAVEIFEKLKDPAVAYSELSSEYGMTYFAISHMAQGNSWQKERALAEYIPFKRKTGRKRRRFLPC
jgi:hypothetical protein